MTIHMEKVYSGMAEAFSEQLESSLLSGKEFFKLTFEEFRLKMKALRIINNKLTAKEKWENMFLDGIAYPIGQKQQSAFIDVRELVRVSGYENKNKYKFLNEPTQEVKV